MESLAVVGQKSYLTAETLPYYPLTEANEQYQEIDWQKLKTLPLYETDHELVVACSNLDAIENKEKLTLMLAKKILIVFAVPVTIQAGHQSVAKKSHPLPKTNS